MPSLGVILAIAALGYLLIGLLIYIRQHRFVYFPDSDVSLSPTDAAMAFEEVELLTADGETLQAWHIAGAEGTELPGRGLTLLFCHGNAGNIGHRIGSIRAFHDLGLTVLLFDYRGYGASSGTPSEQGTYQDAMAAWQHLVVSRKTPPASVVIFGRSLGGAIATWLAEQVQPAGLILESTFTSAPDMGATMFPWFPIRLFSRFQYDNLGRIDHIDCPLLIAHSPDDAMIPYRHAERLYAQAKQPKTLASIAGDHNDSGIERDTAYRDLFITFLRNLQ